MASYFTHFAVPMRGMARPLPVQAYGEVRGSLAAHAEGFPTAAEVHAVVEADDPRPVNIAIWGGQTDLAQALYPIQADRSPEEYAAFVAKLRVHDIADQDGIFDWMWGQFPGLWCVLDKAESGGRCGSVFRGMFLGGEESLVDRAWLDEHVTRGRGSLGALYPTRGPWTCGNGVNALKEGDTPSWFYFLHRGVNDPAHPEWGGWGAASNAPAESTETPRIGPVVRRAASLPSSGGGAPAKTSSLRAWIGA